MASGPAETCHSAAARLPPTRLGGLDFLRRDSGECGPARGGLGLTGEICEAINHQTAKNSFKTGVKNVVLMVTTAAAFTAPERCYEARRPSTRARASASSIATRSTSWANCYYDASLTNEGYPTSALAAARRTSEMLYLSDLQAGCASSLSGRPRRALPPPGQCPVAGAPCVYNCITHDGHRSSEELGKRLSDMTSD